MSHHLVLLVTWADSPIEACKEAETYLKGWGDVDNWRQVYGCVSSDDEVYDNDGGGREWLDNTINTIEEINKLTAEKLAPSGLDRNFAIEAMHSYLNNSFKKNNSDPYIWYNLKKFAEHMDGWCRIKYATTFNVLTDSFRPGEYGEFSVTQMDENDKTPNSVRVIKDQKQYVVFIDMHT